MKIVQLRWIHENLNFKCSRKISHIIRAASGESNWCNWWIQYFKKCFKNYKEPLGSQNKINNRKAVSMFCFLVFFSKQLDQYNREKSNTSLKNLKKSLKLVKTKHITGKIETKKSHVIDWLYFGHEEFAYKKMWCDVTRTSNKKISSNTETAKQKAGRVKKTIH